MKLTRGFVMVCVVGALAGTTFGAATWIEDFDGGSSGGNSGVAYAEGELLIGGPDANWGNLALDGSLGVGFSGSAVGLRATNTGNAMMFDEGIGRTLGPDSLYEGGPNGNSYDFSGLGGGLAVYSVMASNRFSSNGYQQHYLGDASIKNASNDNYYRLDTTGDVTTLDLVVNGALSDSVSGAYSRGQGWTRFDFVVNSNGSVSVFETDVVDSDPAGAAVGDATTNLLGTLAAGGFTLDHFGMAYGPSNQVQGGGAALGPFDNFSVLVPEPASLMLLGLGGLALVRRKR